ncbi:MAG: lactate utilization protein [Treponema sp.]|nr:lactate utilization protein [Treponema sp.]
MLEPVKKLFDLQGPKVVESLKKRNFEAYYCSDKESAVKKILEIIPANHSVAWGGTMTMDQLGLKAKLEAAGYSLIDRDKGSTPDERELIMHKALNCGSFIMSSNAITEDGQLFNIDGKGNRVAALIYGPENVVIIAGMNKVVKDMDAAYARVRGYAAPANAQRFDIDTPCKKVGECMNCMSSGTICAQFVTTRFCKPAGRIKVVLIGEELGI